MIGRFPRARWTALALGCAAVIALAAPARAQEPHDKDWVQPPKDLPRAERGEPTYNLDTLFAALKIAPDESSARAIEQRIPAAQRLASGAEVQIGFDLEQALAETERCFSCGTCIDCDNCVHYCPDLAVKREAGRYVVLADYCKGCGLCVKECPTGSMKMIEDVR